MKTIGMIGGMSWESTIPYYRIINEEIRNRLADRSIETLIPEPEEIETLNSMIFNELCIGEICEESRRRCHEIIDRLHDKGAEGIILGCTELGLIIGQNDVEIPVFDTTVIHAEKAAELALEE